MIRDITFGQYYAASSPIHLLDPRIKILWTFLLIVLIFVADTPYAFLLLAAFIGGVIAVSGVPFRFILRGMKPILFLIIFTAVINLVMIRGETPLFTVWRISVYREGVRAALIMLARMTLLVCGTCMLTYTTSPILLTDGIEALLKPLRVLHFPSHEIAMMMTIALRFIPTLLDETDKIIKAQTARGADFTSGNLIQRAKALLPILIPLFVSSFRRADELASAMESRCYRGGDQRTRMKQMTLSASDGRALIIGMLLIAGIVLIRIYT